MIRSVAEHILGLHGWAALAVVFALPALESSAFVGFVFPGEIAVLLGGVLAFEHRVGLIAVLIAAITGAIAGDSVGYAVGRWWGRRLLTGSLGRWVKGHHLDRAERYLAERGGNAVFFGRFTAALRVMVPGLAGMARMPYLTFAAYNAAGGAIWATLMVLVGYLAGNGWRHAEHVASRVGLGLLAVLFTAVGVSYVLRRVRAQGHTLAHRVASSTPVEKLRGRFPAQTAWVARRFDSNEPAGLGLTVVVAAGVAAVWTFAGLTQDVLGHEEAARLDPMVQSFAVAHRYGWLTELMKVTSWLGSSAVLVPVLLVAAGLLYGAERSRRPLIDLVAAYAGAVTVHAVVVELVRRARPPAAHALVHVTGWGYPSGHATQAVAVWGMLLFLLARGRAVRTRALLILGATAIVVVAGASRIYLGVHWLTDVLGGAALGGGWLAVLLVLRQVPARRRNGSDTAADLNVSGRRRHPSP